MVGWLENTTRVRLPHLDTSGSPASSLLVRHLEHFQWVDEWFKNAYQVVKVRFTFQWQAS
jgi:hypothetical protein